MVTSVENYVRDRFDGLPDLVAEHLDDDASPFVAVARANLAGRTWT